MINYIHMTHCFGLVTRRVSTIQPVQRIYFHNNSHLHCKSLLLDIGFWKNGFVKQNPTVSVVPYDISLQNTENVSVIKLSLEYIGCKSWEGIDLVFEINVELL